MWSLNWFCTWMWYSSLCSKNKIGLCFCLRTAPITVLQWNFACVTACLSSHHHFPFLPVSPHHSLLFHSKKATYAFIFAKIACCAVISFMFKLVHFSSKCMNSQVQFKKKKKKVQSFAWRTAERVFFNSCVTHNDAQKQFVFSPTWTLRSVQDAVWHCCTKV